jgi:hypothetical protein
MAFAYPQPYHVDDGQKLTQFLPFSQGQFLKDTNKKPGTMAGF